MGHWDRERRVIARLEHGPQGANLSFVVTSLAGDAADLYEWLYCARGEVENRIKEAQLACGVWSFEARSWNAATIRTKLLKIGAAVLRNTRRVRLLSASQHPLKHVFVTRLPGRWLHSPPGVLTWHADKQRG